jgi:hypothetical protein
MIKGIMGSGSVVVNGNNPVFPYFNMNFDNPSCGAMRYNTTFQNMEVFDGSSWKQITSGAPIISLTVSAETAIAWATRKMDEEAEWKKLAKASPAVAIALENLNKAKEQLTVIAHLSREYETTS